MSTTTLERFTPTSEISFPIDTAEIAEAVSPCLSMKIAGVNDTAGFRAVHEARMKLRGMRVQIEEKRKELKAGALEYGKLVDSEAKRLTAPLLPAEEHLANEEERINSEKARIKREAEEARQRKIQERITALEKCRASVNLTAVSTMTDEEFETHLAEAFEANRVRLEDEAKAAAERKRIADEQAAAAKAEREKAAAEAEERRKAEEARLTALREEQRLESERMAAERAELDRQRKEQAEAAAKIEAERKRLADEAAAAERRAQVEQERAAKAARQAEQVEGIDAWNAPSAPAAPIYSDHEKLSTVLNTLRGIVVPAVAPESQAIADAIRKELTRAANAVAKLLK